MNYRKVVTLVTASSSRRWWALIAIAASVVVVGLDLTVLNLALPTIAGDLHASTGDLQWISDSYSLVLAAIMLPAGMLGDRYGRKRVLLIALVLFLLSSAACAYSASVGELITARAIMGVGAAAIFPLALSVLPVIFSKEELPRAIAVIASANMISFPIGPIVGGYLLDNFWWGSVFLINVPVVLIALVAVIFLLPESRSARRQSVDFVGLVVSSGGLTALTYGFIRAGQDGWGSAVAIATISRRGRPARGVRAAGAAGHGRRPSPAADRVGPVQVGGVPVGHDLDHGRVVRHVRAAVRHAAVLPGGPGHGRARQRPAAAADGRRHAGRHDLGCPALVTAQGPLGCDGTRARGRADPHRRRLRDHGRRHGAWEPSPQVASSTGYAAAWIAIAGLGLGLAMPPAMNVALSQLSAERSGSGSAVISALRQVGATIGVAILGTLISNAYTAGVPANGLPAAVASLARSSVTGGVAVARMLKSAALLEQVRDRVRARHGHHAVDLRRDRARRGPARSRVPARRSASAPAAVAATANAASRHRGCG